MEDIDPDEKKSFKQEITLTTPQYMSFVKALERDNLNKNVTIGVKTEPSNPHDPATYEINANSDQDLIKAIQIFTQIGPESSTCEELLDKVAQYLIINETQEFLVPKRDFNTTEYITDWIKRKEEFFPPT